MQRDGTGRILLLATGRWVSTARLAMALASFGCRLEFCGLKRHPARTTGVFEHTFRYNPLNPLASIRNALANGFPIAELDAVIPVDELALMHLIELSSASEEVRALLERSVGGEEVLAAARSRMRLLELAKRDGVRVPETVQPETEESLAEAVQHLGLPVVLKADATSGGRGVRVADSLSQARREWKLLQRPPSLPRAIKRGWMAGEWTHLRPWAQRTRTGVTAQRFVRGGKERTGMAVCVGGRVVSQVCLEVLETWCERGPSSVVRIISSPEMELAMGRVAERLGVTGFCGFDFMVDPATGETLLIEMNPRPTQLVHLPLGPGCDLVAAYVREILRLPAEDRHRVAGDTIALFPLALEAGTVRPDAFHDVPWAAPDLIRHVLRPIPAQIQRDARWQGEKL